MFTTRFPEKRPSCASMFTERIMMRSSFEMIDVMFDTMPMSSLPMMRSVME